MTTKRFFQISLPVLVILAAIAATGTAMMYRANQDELTKTLDRVKALNTDLSKQLLDKSVELDSLKYTIGEPTRPKVNVAKKKPMDTMKEALEQKDQLIAELKGQLTAKPELKVAVKSDDPPWKAWEAKMAQLKQEDPEKYQQMQDGIKSFQTRIKDATARKSAFFINLDTSSMNDEQLESHEKLLTLMNRSMEIQKQMGDESLDPERMYDLKMEMRENMPVLSELFESEREFAMSELGKSLGYTDEEAVSLNQYVAQIYEATSMRGFFRGGKPRGGRPAKVE